MAGRDTRIRIRGLSVLQGTGVTAEWSGRWNHRCGDVLLRNIIKHLVTQLFRVLIICRDTSFNMVNTFGRQNKTSITRTRSGCLQCRHKRRKVHLTNFLPVKANLCSATRQNLFAIDAQAMAAYANTGIGWNSVIPPSGRLTKSSKPNSTVEDPKLTTDLDERIPHHQHHTYRMIL